MIRRALIIVLVSFCLLQLRFGSVHTDVVKDVLEPTCLSSLGSNYATNHLANSSFEPVTVNVRVLYPNDDPMSDVMVAAVNHEFYLRCRKTTNATGWVTFEAMVGNWSFFAYPGRSIQKGEGYFPCSMNQSLSNPVEEVILKPDALAHVELVSSIAGLTDLDLTEVTLTESHLGFFETVNIAGKTDQNNITLHTQHNITARISLHKKAQQTQPGVVFVSKPIPLKENIQINITDSNTGRLRLEFSDVQNNPASGAHVQFHALERSWQWSPHIVDYSFSNLTFIVSAMNLWVFCGTDVIENATRYRMLFDSKYIRSEAGNETLLKFGGPINYEVLVTPKAAADFKPATQVLLYATDYSENRVAEVWHFGDSTYLRPNLTITTDLGKEVEIQMQGALYGFVEQEFDQSLNPMYTVSCDFGPFENHTFEGSLYDPLAVKMIIYETDRLIVQSPAIDRDLRIRQANFYEALFTEMEEWTGVPTDYKIGVISNTAWAGFEDEILHGFKLELPLEIRTPLTWPHGDGYIGHEMGHGRIHKPPANYHLWGESYATLMGYKARASLSGEPLLLDFLMGGHDLFLRHQHGTPVETWYDQIEIVEFIVYYVDKVYGWDAHRSMILEWENAFAPMRDLLASNGFSDIEQMATIYSYLVDENIALLFELGGFNVTESTVNKGIDLILGDQQQTGKDELKIGEVTAITHTVSVPIMLRRFSAGLTEINVTVSFDDTLAEVLRVHKRDLTSSSRWNLTTNTDVPGEIAISLRGSDPITRIGSLAQINFEVAFTNRTELPLTILNASTDSGSVVDTEGGSIALSQLSPTRPENLPFEIIWNEEAYYAVMSSNSTINDFTFNPSNSTVSFDVTAPIGTAGFCHFTLPNVLVLNNCTIYLDGVLLTKGSDYIETFNETHHVFSITYRHTTHTIEIVIPELPSLVILPLFMISTFLIAMIYRKRALDASPLELKCSSQNT